MGNNIEFYRAAIGLFNRCKRMKFGPNDFRTDTHQDIIMTNLRCAFLFASLMVLQNLCPKINVVFLLFVLHFILLIGNVELNPGPETLNMSSSSLSVKSSDKSISICNINIRSLRNKIDFLENFFDEFDIVAVTETHLDSRVKS